MDIGRAASGLLSSQEKTRQTFAGVSLVNRIAGPLGRRDPRPQRRLASGEAAAAEIEGELVRLTAKHRVPDRLSTSHPAKYPDAIATVSAGTAPLQPAGNAATMFSPSMLGCCSVAPSEPQAEHRIRCRRRSPEASAPHRMMKGARATGTLLRQFPRAQ